MTNQTTLFFGKILRKIETQLCELGVAMTTLVAYCLNVFTGRHQSQD